MLEISERFKKSIAEAKTPFERQAMERERDVQLNNAKADAAEKQAELKAAADKEADESAKRTAKYQVDAQAALLEAQGRGQDAQLLKFDAEWQTRIE